MRFRVFTAIIGLLAGVAVATGPTTATSAAAATPPALDGASSATAAPSCWAIKQSYPASVDGVYWLVTAKLVEPEQFYCDMTTDGGGWVLVGRGREGWTLNDDGQRSHSTVRDTVNGTAAFAPAALDRVTINGLLDGGRVDALADGIRIRRAANATGTTWQEVRWFAGSLGDWDWAFGGGIILNHATINGVNYRGSNTADSNTNYNNQTLNDLRNVNTNLRWNTTPQASHNLKIGFGYGTTVTGTNSPTTYLWQYTTERNAIPFSQLFIRPRLTSTGFSAIPDTGLAASSVPDHLSSKPEVAPWGVTGLAPRAEKVEPEGRTLVLSFQQIGTTMFVGGRFVNVQNGSTATPIVQSYLAAFDVNTGEWISSFRPVLDGRVWDMAVAPNGKLIIAGDFTNVSGAANTAGMAELDPVTGAVDASFTASFARVDSSGFPAMVRAIDTQDGFIYAGGTFNRFKGPGPNQITVGRLVKINIATGALVQAWKPVVLAGVVDLDASSRGDRVYVVGYFNATNGDTTKGYSGQVNTTTGANIPGLAPWQPSTTNVKGRYQQAVLEVGDRVYQGGAEHDNQMYNRDTYALMFSHTFRQGGDIQAITKVGGRIYSACHCNNWDYEGSNAWNPPTGYLQPNPVTWIGAYDATTFRQDVDFQPTVENGAGGEGAWALEGDSNSCLWFGGDFTLRGFTGAPTDWLGGFGKMCPVEQTPPTTPYSLSVSAAGNNAQLSWQPSTDAVGPVKYEVMRNDRVIGTTASLTFTDPNQLTNNRYWVRAVDGAGNVSATSNMAAFTAPAQTVATFITAGSSWSYSDDGADLGTAWRGNGADVSAWKTGSAEFGWGDGDETTAITAGPITSYFVKDITVGDTSAMKALRISLKRDDGAVVYINGVEVRRDNMPAGTITSSTPASSFISGGAESVFTDVTIPAALISTGTNRIAVELHQGGANNGDASFDLQLAALGAVEDTTAPTTPSVTATGGAGQVTVSWSGSTDAVGVEGFLIYRDGNPVAAVPAAQNGFTDSGLGFDEGHAYSVRAYDLAGNLSAAGSASATTTSNPLLVPFKATWKWWYDATAPDASWTGAGYDDSGWSSGAGELGFGDLDETTVIPMGTTPRPVTAYFRNSFTVTNPGQFTSLTLSVVRDDGVAVYLNGTEIARDNLPDGALTPTTGALIGQSTRAQETTPVTFTIPASALVAGSNVITAEVHNLDAFGGDLSFDLRLASAG